MKMNKIENLGLGTGDTGDTMAVTNMGIVMYKSVL